MKIWEFAKVEGSSIKVDKWVSDTMGLIEGGCVYSTLFKYPMKGPKMYELILSMFPQENYRTLTKVTMYLQDVPGASAQAARFLADRGINILNSISLNGISDTIIVWKILADLNFTGEGDISKERLAQLKAARDPSVDKIDHISVKATDIGRVFRTETAQAQDKIEVRKGAPQTLKDGAFDTSREYGDVLSGVGDSNVLITMDSESWILSITFFRPGTRLVRLGLDIPDCPGAITQALELLASKGLNLISIFSKVKIAYQTMSLELVADIGGTDLTVRGLGDSLPEEMSGFNGIFELTECSELE